LIYKTSGAEALPFRRKAWPNRRRDASARRPVISYWTEAKCPLLWPGGHQGIAPGQPRLIGGDQLRLDGGSSVASAGELTAWRSAVDCTAATAEDRNRGGKRSFTDARASGDVAPKPAVPVDRGL